MSVILIIYLIGGCFIDALAFVTLTVPIFYPVVQQLGYDPVWFGVMIVMITQMGVITPPIGINVYVVYGVAQTVFRQTIPLQTIFKGVVPFVIALIAGVIILILFPRIILYLPNLLY
jgi:TRAP-type C4-dicarboxylate transport system permease large subunit